MLLDGVTIVLWSVAVVPALSHVAFRNSCGDLTCSEYEFCRTGAQICVECSEVCSQSSRDYHDDLCTGKCQDYVHDVLKGYVKRDDLKDLTTEGIVIIVLLLVLVVLNGGTITRKWYRNYVRRRIQKRQENKLFQQKLASVQYITGAVNNNNNNNNSVTRDEAERCTIQSVQTIPSRSPLPSTTTLMTQMNTPCNTEPLRVEGALPLCTEEPCEDVIDYAAYVNWAMSQSPNGEPTIFRSGN